MKGAATRKYQCGSPSIPEAVLWCIMHKNLCIVDRFAVAQR